MEITGNVNATVNAEVDANVCVNCKNPLNGPFDSFTCCHMCLDGKIARNQASFERYVQEQNQASFERNPEIYNCVMQERGAAERPIVKCPKHGEEFPCGACHFTQPQTRRIKKTPKMNEHLDHDLEMIRFCLRQLEEKRTEMGHLELELDELLDIFERHAIEERE